MLRVGTVPFLVARPLSRGLDSHPKVRLELAAPAVLGRRLRAGSLDVALASSVLALEHPELEFWTAGPVIASRGAVRSVLVLLRPGLSPAEVSRLALDPGSRTGRALAQILLRELHGASPLTEEQDPGEALRAGRCDAVQAIGDRAIQLAAAYPEWTALDLGQAWLDWTGTPFVFAGWIARPGLAREEFTTILRDAAVRGLDAREELIPEGVQLLGRDAAFVRRYLYDDLVYALPAEETRAALDRFRAHLVEAV